MAALLLLLLLLSLVALPIALAWLLLLHDPQAAQVCFVLIGVVFVTGPIFLILSAEVRCPLCRGQVLGGLNGSARSTKVQTFLGSYRLRVILSLMFTGSYRCMHCGEPCDGTRPRHR